MTRTGTLELDVNSAINDINKEFGRLGQDKIIKAIRNGSLGKYGRTYKLTTQEICVWIRSYLKENSKVY